MCTNGCVYETFGTSNRFAVKLKLFLIRAEKLEFALHRQLTIPLVTACRFIPQNSHCLFV